MTKIKDILSLKKDIVFGGAVQTDWYYDKEKSSKITENFIFHGPKFFGVTDDDVEFKSHKLMDTCTYADLISNKLYDEEGNPIVLTIAGYGTGKSHLAVTLGKLFSSDGESEEYKNILKNIKCADEAIAKDVKAKTGKPNLVIVINGMKDFNLNYEILTSAKRVLKEYGYGEEIFSEYTKAYSIAQRFLELNFDNFKEEFEKEASKYRFDTQNLKEYLLENIYKDEVFDSINEVYFKVVGNYIRWDDGISSSEVLGKLVEKMCGDSAPFNKILILFDEFGRYIEYASEYPNRAGDSALQQIFEVIQDSNNNILFVGFIQSDLKTYLSRVNKTSNISRYIGRYESGEKLYLSSNLETIFANLIKTKDQELYNNYIKNYFNKEKFKEENKKIFEKIGEWIPSSKNRGVWSDFQKFKSVIQEGIYPFNPISIWILTYLSDWYQQRSAINFLINAFEMIQEEEITELGTLPQILPIDIIKGDLFKELLLAENEGRQKSENCTLYDKIYIKYNAKLLKEDFDVLAGILVLKLGRFKNKSKEDCLEALTYVTGLNSNKIENILNKLEEQYGVIEYDERNFTFDFIEDATGINDFKRFIKKKKINLGNKDIEIFLNNDVKEKIGINSNFQTSFGKKNNIKTNEWVYEQDIVTARRVDKVYIENMIKDVKESTSPDRPKGRLIYIYTSPEDNFQVLENLVEMYKQYEINNLPIIWVLIDDNEKYMYNALLDLDISNRFTKEEEMKFSKFILTFENKAEEALKNSFDNMKKSRMIFSKEGIKQSELRLIELTGKKFADIYTKAVSFPFDGFDKKALAAAKKLYSNIVKGVISNHINYQWIQLQTSDTKNRVKAVMENPIIGWGVLDSEYNIVVPSNMKIRAIFDEIDSELENKETLNLYSLYCKYIQAPYGQNEYVFGLIIAIYIALKSIELKVFYKGIPVKNIDWANNFYTEKALDLRYLKDTSLKNVDLDEYLQRYNLICSKIEKNKEIEKCPNLKIELEKIISEEEAPEEIQTRVESCKRMIIQGTQIYNKVAEKIGSMEANMEKGKEETDFKKIIKVIIECEEISVDSIQDGLPYTYSAKHIDIFKRLSSEGRKLIETSYEGFLKKTKCQNVGQATKYEEWLKMTQKDLEKLGYLDLARKTKTKRHRDLENLELMRKRQSMHETINGYCSLVNPTNYTSQEELIKWKNEGEDIIQFIRGNGDFDSIDIRTFEENINPKLEKVKLFLEKINNDIMNIIDRSLELKDLKESKILLSDIKNILDRKLREVDRNEINQIGDVLQDFIKDMNEVEKVESFSGNIKEATLLKDKYDEYDGEILSINSVIDSYCEEINNKVKDLSLKWKERNLSINIKDIDSWRSNDCFTWIDRTRIIPEYVDSAIRKEYQEIYEVVQNRINTLNIESIVNIFEKLSEEEKVACIDVLKNRL